MSLEALEALDKVLSQINSGGSCGDATVLRQRRELLIWDRDFPFCAQKKQPCAGLFESGERNSLGA